VGQAIGVQRHLAKKLAQATGGSAAVDFHLPEPVLGMDKALGKEEIVKVIGVNMWDTPAVTHNLDRGFQPRQVERAVGLGQAAATEPGQSGPHDGTEDGVNCGHR